ncbi:hypothetical protein [Okeania sp. KiyG1]|uniref:hypothetical protein n=1 Tax=Okeania sp. KiyG1 TaxID=2720165 RepID=UPI0019249990|nr:hypothetical protein [Okeania sp. KiyG1]
MTKNDVAWEKLFEKYQILEEVISVISYQLSVISTSAIRKLDLGEYSLFLSP